MKTPYELYVETVAVALHGKYGGAGTPSWTRVKDEVRAEWRRDAEELLEEIRPDLRYITARGQDHHELSEALGVQPGELEWDKLLDAVRELRSAGSYPTAEFARMQATTDIVRTVLRMLSAEYAAPSAHSGDDVDYAEDMLLLAARRLVAARAGDAPLMGAPPVLPSEDPDEPVTGALSAALSPESIRHGMVHGHPAIYNLSTRTGRFET